MMCSNLTIYYIPNGHHSDGHNPEWTPSRMDTIPNGHNPEWTQSRMDTIPHEHLPNVTALYKIYCLVLTYLLLLHEQ